MVFDANAVDRVIAGTRCFLYGIDAHDDGAHKPHIHKPILNEKLEKQRAQITIKII